MAVMVTAAEVENNFVKYIELASEHEVVITRNGLPVARLIGIDRAMSFLSDNLVGLIPQDADENEAKEERMARQ
ncbi:MAG: type II toxin-antitoxin system prevent-host-death family antitoxin [Clostridiales bacterium]|jgi:prevent-host-death family protein|nr:type II toxin-antitoxin system prevent-host-death family antitoxin [Clostridiales bacterium]